jgi:metal-sulfur cluster biosynthetic enzyme
MISPARIRKLLRRIQDPELGFDIVSLGFIYDIKVRREAEVYIKLSLTSPACPLRSFFADKIRRLLKAHGARKVEVKLIFKPPWTPERAEPAVRRALGLNGAWQKVPDETEILDEPYD